MATFIVESFSSGMDLRKRLDTAKPGSLRTLTNAFINEGGEIEKRKAFVLNSTLTEYTQTANYRGKVSGPHPIASQVDAVFFRHRHNSLPGSWTAGSGSLARSTTLQASSGRPLKVWAMKSTIAQDTPDGIMHAASVAAYAEFSYVVETYFQNDGTRQSEFVEVEHAGSGEPTAETEITANEDRRFQITHRSKGYVINNGNTLFATATGDPGDMAGTGSGSIDCRTQGVPIGRLLSLAEFFGQVVVFGQRGCQFWEMNATFASNQYIRSIALEMLGTRTPTPYLYGDVLYLGRSGIRSLRAQDSSNVAHVNDVGSPIDSVIKGVARYEDSTAEYVFSDDQGWQLRNAFFDTTMPTGIVHPESGQFWLCYRDTIYVLSVHPDSKVRAWSTFTLPTPADDGVNDLALEKRAWVADICPIREDLIFRTVNDEVYIYGGPAGDVYDDCEVEVITPHMDMGSPQTVKTIHSIDISCEGTWLVEISTDPENIEWQDIGTVTQSTHTLGDCLPADLTLTHFALRLTSTSEEAAKVAQIAVEYTPDSNK